MAASISWRLPRASGGAHIVELVEAATGLNLWAEWAKVEVAGADGGYQPPVANRDYAALLISLARQQHPDTSAYNDPEIVWRLVQDHHAGLIVKSPSAARVANCYRPTSGASPKTSTPTSRRATSPATEQTLAS